MARKQRITSPTGYYHVTQRGVGKQMLFEDSKDYERYLQNLCDAKEKYNVKLIAYCLMNNHIHLLLYAESVGALSTMMRSLGNRYAAYYNLKYDHSGHVFQDRFFSATIDDEKYLQACLNYIHNNPSKAGISSKDTYPWSSFTDYIYGEGIADTEIILNIFGGITEFMKLSNMTEDVDIKMDDCETETVKMNRAQKIINEEIGYEFNNGLIVKRLSYEERNKILHRLRKEGYTLKQIELLTGVSKRIIERT